ncbi:LIM and calponin homology domains-containing protein 1-like [Anguilla anguilla]|uniref:LIM and calponin homology domains-containing protein 1-like n=1 Tax=Anguilla anguilla TaxID=7936 RepID=UPI0015A93C43|nr:LIM and calponin homology domains-containing protein 1-like [Anguilla anguilla]
MASPGFDIGHHQHSEATPEPAFQEAQKWIEAVTGRRFGDKDFRAGLENGILLCELLSSIKPGLVKKINRLPTPIAGLDNLTLFLRGCEELGLKGSQLFDPGDLQDTSIRANLKGSDCSRKLKNVLITIYWLGKAANSCASYSGPTLDLKEFEGLLTQMRKEVEDGESPKRSIRDSGYIDCWDSERSDSLSPPRHGRDDSFDSLDSFGSRSQQTPSPDVVIRGSSDGRGSDSESDAPHRKLPDMRKDDMLARRTSCSEPRTVMPFNQYLPNKSNQSAYVPAPLRKKRVEHQEECRKSWSTATSPIGGDRPFSVNESPRTAVRKDNRLPRTAGPADEEDGEEWHDLARRKAQNSPLPRGDTLLAFAQTPTMHSDSEERGRTRTTSEPSSSLGFSSSLELYRGLSTTGSAATSIVMTSPVATAPGNWTDRPRKPPLVMDREEAGHGRDPASRAAESRRDDVKMTRHTLNSPKHASLSPTHFLPAPAVQQGRPGKVEGEGVRSRPRRPSWLDDDQAPIFSHRSSVSDDHESVSMIDVRYEEEGIQHPHSQARHELMHNQYNRLREEEDHWQDDLARWKNRRRSISQDLIKKEEERKTMERLLSNDESTSQRRKSIKTYREIVEEKERRERELHEAYRKARTPEEAAAVLQRYAQRFTISEAVLERLHLPKLLDRSVSVDPGAPPHRASSASPTREPSAMKYLRQQSLPAPKFTSTVEAMVGLPQSPARAQNQNQNQARSPERSPNRTLPTKAVPLLTPKPYSQPRNSFSASKPVQVDSMVPVNGETDDVFAPAEDSEEAEKEGGDYLTGFLPSPAQTATRESATKVSAPSTPASGSPRKEAGLEAEPEAVPGDGDAHQSSCEPLNTAPSVSPDPPAEAPEDMQREEDTPTQPTSLPTELQREGVVREGEAEVGLLDAPDGTAGREGTDQPCLSKEVQHVKEQVPSLASSVATDQNAVAAGPAPAELPVTDGHQHANTPTATQVSDRPLESAQGTRDNLLPAHTPPPNPPQGPLNAGVELDSAKAKPQILVPVLNLPKRSDHFSWDPNEERRRQERWQQEQDRMLQEKYRREQEKLKQEWERAQREVEEEERKYHEEEQKILEETVAPLTPRSSALSSPNCAEKPPLAGPQDTIVRSLADWERKQELLERQARGVDGEREEQREHPDWNEAVSGQSTAATKDCRFTESSQSLNYGQTEAIPPAQQNGQRSPTAPQLQFLPGETAPLTAPSWNSRQTEQQGEEEVWRKTASLDRNWNTPQTQPGGMKRSGSYENLGTNSSPSSSCSSDVQPQSPNRSVSGKKLCSSCGHPLGKGAAMIIETLSLYFHIQCFKCGICKGQLGDTSTGTDVRIRSGLLNCHQCYIRSRSAGQPTTL